jgi:hypothetical protein
MGFLNVLGKIAGLVPLPGMSLVGKGLEAAGGIGDVLGKQQAGAAKGAADTAQLTQGQDRNAINLYDAKQNAQNHAADTDLERKKFTTSDRSANFKQALIAELLGHGGGGLTMNGIPQTHGGFADALQGSGAQAALASLGGAAHAAQDAPVAFQGGAMVNAPTLTAMPEQSGTSKFADTIARIAQLGGAAAPFIPKKKPQPMSETDGL